MVAEEIAMHDFEVLKAEEPEATDPDSQEEETSEQWAEELEREMPAEDEINRL